MVAKFVHKFKLVSEAGLPKIPVFYNVLWVKEVCFANLGIAFQLLFYVVLRLCYLLIYSFRIIRSFFSLKMNITPCSTLLRSNSSLAFE